MITQCFPEFLAKTSECVIISKGLIVTATGH